MSKNHNPTDVSSVIDEDADELELLTVHQVAELFNVPVKYVYAKAASGDLPSIKIGAYRRFRRADLRAYLATGADTAEESST